MNSRNLLFTSLFFLLAFSLSAQVKELPFATDWLTTVEQNEWTEYQLGATGFFDWSMNTSGTLTHDYPVGNTQADTVRDWMVSPTIKFHSTSKMNLRLYVFALIDTVEVDYFGVWFSDGSKNPNDGDYQEIVDLTELVGPAIYEDTMGIEIPFTANEGYIAFVYEATNNWFTVGIDSIAIIPDELPTNTETLFLEKEINVYPNPVTDQLKIIIEEAYRGDIDSYEIVNKLGVVISKGPISNNILNTADLVAGVYFLALKKDKEVVGIKKFVKF